MQAVARAHRQRPSPAHARSEASMAQGRSGSVMVSFRLVLGPFDGSSGSASSPPVTACAPTWSRLSISLLKKYFLWHVVYFYRFCLNYISVPFFSLTRSAIALQQADSVLQRTAGVSPH